MWTLSARSASTSPSSPGVTVTVPDASPGSSNTARGPPMPAPVTPSVSWMNRSTVSFVSTIPARSTVSVKGWPSRATGACPVTVTATAPEGAVAFSTCRCRNDRATTPPALRIAPAPAGAV